MSLVLSAQCIVQGAELCHMQFLHACLARALLGTVCLAPTHPRAPSLRVVCAPTPAGNCLCVPLTAAHWAREQCRRAPYPQPAISRRWSFRDLTLGRAIQCVRESPDTVSAVCAMTWECGQPPYTARGHEFIPGESLGGELQIGVQLVALLHMEHSK